MSRCRLSFFFIDLEWDGDGIDYGAVSPHVRLPFLPELMTALEYMHGILTMLQTRFCM